VLKIGPLSGRKTSMHVTYDEDIKDKNKREVKLPVEKAERIVESIKRLDEELAEAETPDEMMDITKEKMRVLRDAGVLPPNFTWKNLTKAAEMLRGLASDVFHFDRFNIDQSQTETPLTTSPRNISRWAWYMGFLSAAIFFTPGGMILHFIRLPVDEDLLVGGRIEWQGPILRYLSNLTGINYSAMIGWGGGIYYFGVFIGASLTIAFILSALAIEHLPNRITFFKPTLFNGCFISSPLAFAAVSLTLVLKRGIAVDIPLFDLIIIGAGALPLLPARIESS
jgi:hypothetical protein